MNLITYIQKKYIFSLAIFFYLLFSFNVQILANNQQTNAVYKISKILAITVDSSINPGTYSYLTSAFEKAKKSKSDALLIKLNTPGGLVSTTKDILSLIGKADIPTIVWITPEGASATSAGAILAAGAHYVFMSRGTNIGAATPINFNAQDISKDLRSKAINDLVALVTSLAQERGKNAEFFANMIKNASSYTAKEAQENILIDNILDSEKDLAKVMANTPFVIRGNSYVVQIENPIIESFEMDFGQKLLDILAHPNVAYILFLIGAALLYIEFQSMGGLLAGALGVLFLILAAIGFQVLPLNFGALGLIVLSFILFVIEIFITSYGLLSVAGLLSLIFGSLFLYRTDDAYIQLSQGLIFTAVFVIFTFMLFLAYFLFRDFRKHKAPKNYYDLTQKQGKIVAVLKSDPINQVFCYQVRVSGEIWMASSKDSYELGDTCTVKSVANDMMTLVI